VSEGATSLRTMCPSPSNSSELIAGGAQPKMLVVNTQTGSLVRQVSLRLPSPDSFQIRSTSFPPFFLIFLYTLSFARL
jgi:hypothetical protein